MRRPLAAIALFGFTASAIGLPSCASSQDAAVEQSADVAQMDNGSMNDSGMMDHSGMMQMDLGPADESFDLRFMDAMVLHHQGAVDMAEDALQKSTRPETQTLAKDIIAAQQTEIAQMQGWRQTWYPDAAAEPVMFDAQMGHMMPMSQDMMAGMMMNSDLGAADDDYDLRFINSMIPHHEGALDMAQEALEKSTRPEIQQLAQAILDSQQPEIDQMMKWRQAWYAQ